MTIFEDIKRRIEALRREHGVDQGVIADKIREIAIEDGKESNFRQQTLSKYLKSKTGESKNTVYILEALRFFEANRYGIARQQRTENGIREAEPDGLRLCRLFNSMDDHKKVTLLQTAEIFAAASKS